jgi:tRNA (cmo5U34)-methyltransferase
MSVKKLFDQGVDRYDRQRRKVIPCFNDFYQTVIDLIPFDTSQSFQLLDLGAGTGLLTDFIVKTFSNATATLIDLSEKMLEKAKERFSSNKQVSFLSRDYAHGQLPQNQDLIVSAMSIHHLPDQEKKSLYKKVFEALNPEGIFINADLVKGETDNIDRRYQDNWLRWIERAGLQKTELCGILDRMRYDRPSTLTLTLQWLQEAGFRDVDCSYKYYNFSVVSGQRKLKSARTIRSESNL